MSLHPLVGTRATAGLRFVAVAMVLGVLLIAASQTAASSDGAPSATSQQGDAGPHVYWANNKGTTIGRARLDGSHAVRKFVSGAGRPCGLAIFRGQLYWAEEASAAVGRVRLDGTGVKHRFIKGAAGPVVWQ